MKELNLKSEITDEQMIEVQGHFINSTFNTVLTPEMDSIISTVVEHYKNGEFVQVVEDELLKLFGTGKFNFVEICAVMRTITYNNVIISYKHYPWFEDIMASIVPSIKEGRRLMAEQKKKESQ